MFRGARYSCNVRTRATQCAQSQTCFMGDISDIYVLNLVPNKYGMLSIVDYWITNLNSYHKLYKPKYYSEMYVDLCI